MNDPIPRIISRNNTAIIKPLGLMPEPFGDIGYLELVDTYAEKAFDTKAAGAQSIVATGFAGLVEARAAVLGMRQSGLNLHVSLHVDGDGETENGADPLASLICLQELGISTFGIDGEFKIMMETLLRLMPYANIPLFAVPENVDQATKILELGANMLVSAQFTRKELEILQIIASGLGNVQKPPRPENSPLLLADETQVYYLEEDFTISEPIDCELDIPEQILAAEDEGFDVLLFQITSQEDVISFVRASYMARCAVCFAAESEELLDAVLVHYTGRAIVSSRSDLDETAIETLATGYGGIIIPILV